MKPSTSKLGELLDKLSRKKSQPQSKSQASARLEMDYSLHNTGAAEWAMQNTGSTYPDLNQDQRENIRNAVVEFIKTPGFTIGDAMNLLSKDFDKEKAELIARTEITRAYAWDAQTKGEKQKKEYPDLRVTKTWYTCNDDRVCDICSPLNGKEVDIDKPFTEGVFIPPAHAGCRCWISSSTRILSSPV